MEIYLLVSSFTPNFQCIFFLFYSQIETLFKCKQNTNTCSDVRLSNFLRASFKKLSKFLTVCTWDFQQCGNLTFIDSDEPVQPPLSLETPNAVRSVAYQLYTV